MFAQENMYQTDQQHIERISVSSTQEQTIDKSIMSMDLVEENLPLLPTSTVGSLQSSHHYGILRHLHETVKHGFSKAQRHNSNQRLTQSRVKFNRVAEEPEPYVYQRIWRSLLLCMWVPMCGRDSCIDLPNQPELPAPSFNEVAIA